MTMKTAFVFPGQGAQSVGMMAAYAGSGSSSSVETSQVLDRDRYYSGWLNGPLDPDRKPRLILTFSVPNKAE